MTDEDGLESVTFVLSVAVRRWCIRRPTSLVPRVVTYTLSDDDQGKTVKVRVSFTDDAGNEETLTSEATAAIEARANNPATGQPTISGTAQVGETLTVDTSGIDDEDGMESVTYVYQWLSGDGASETDIAGATSVTYTLSDDEEGKTVKVRVSFTDDAGNEEILTSEATAVVGPAAEEVVWRANSRSAGSRMSSRMLSAIRPLKTAAEACPLTISRSTGPSTPLSSCCTSPRVSGWGLTRSSRWTSRCRLADQSMRAVRARCL